MIYMSNETRSFLRENLPDSLQATDVNDILIPLDAWIFVHGMGPEPECELNDAGVRAQAAYDDLYYSND